jgi:ABC-type transporter Mla subunit MlaD
MSARFNALLAAGMGVVVAMFFVAATLYIGHHPHAESPSTRARSTIRTPGRCRES